MLLLDFCQRFGRHDLSHIAVSAEDVPPESVDVSLLTSILSAPLLGGTWLVGLVGFSMGLTIGLLTKKGFLIVR